MSAYEKITKNIVIHDTPPYNTGNLKSLIQEVDLILIPCKLMYPDLLALRALSDELKKLNMTQRSVQFTPKSQIMAIIHDTYSIHFLEIYYIAVAGTTVALFSIFLNLVLVRSLAKPFYVWLPTL